MRPDGLPLWERTRPHPHESLVPWGNHLVSMLLLRLSAQDLLTLNLRRRMVPHLAARYRHFRGRDVSDTEREAWAESLIELAEDLVEAERGNVEMVVECAATVDEPQKGSPPSSMSCSWADTPRRACRRSNSLS